MAFSSATITHSWLNPDGSGPNGYAVFTLTKAMTNGSSTIMPGTIRAPIQNGALSQTLTANSDAGTSPTDTQYRVDLRLAGMNPISYFITVPSGGGTIDLGTLLPSEGTTVPMDITTVWQPYLDMQLDVKPYLQISASNTKYDQTILNRITAMACNWVQNYLQRPVPPTTFTRKFDGFSGWTGSYLQLPYYPILQIVSINEWWGGSGGHVLNEQTPEDQNNGEMYQVDRLTGQVTRTFAGLIEKPFFPGSRNIEVEWIAGYNPIPDDLITGTLELVDYWFRNTQEAVRTARPQMDYDTIGNNPLWPAVPNRITSLLEPYKCYSSMIG